jgi:carbon-monoxide dehydrogenase medium subunit
MIPAPFDYHRPASLEAALALLSSHGDDAKILAGGHSLIPAMKLRLAQPSVVVDLGAIKDLAYVRRRAGGFAIGAMTTHYQVEASSDLGADCPILPAVAPHIGDVQVRNKGTIGGSLVHADPASDWPAAILALDAELEIAGPRGRRVVHATEFFVDLFQTALGPGEILCEIRVPSTPRTVSYVKTRQPASGFALCGVAAVVDGTSVRLGVTGVAPTPYRATASERTLVGVELSADQVRLAGSRAADGVRLLNDIHASAEFRAHLARVNTVRALTQALGRA